MKKKMKRMKCKTMRKKKKRMCLLKMMKHWQRKFKKKRIQGQDDREEYVWWSFDCFFKILFCHDDQQPSFITIQTVVYKDFDEEEDEEEEDVGSSSAPRVRSRYVKGSRGTRTTVKRKPRTTTRATSSRTTRSSRRAASGDSEDELDFIPQKELRSRSTRVNYA